MNISASTIQPHRRLKKVEEDENAATLQLGREFQLTQINHHGEEEDLIALNLSEARLIIKEALIGRRQSYRKNLKMNKKKKTQRNNDDDSTAVEDDDKDEDDDDDEALMHTETREKELESIDALLEQTTGGNNKDLKNSMEYLTNFSRFRDQETVAAVLQLLKSTGLHPFEVAQLGTLACDTADEAKTLIPSLTNKISDDDLERILKELSNLETLY
ncbi:uncharacterized protein GVI51_I04147 [Nakaseomyces glabratus]|uniref:RNA polymerase Rpb4/RPC9 core domain-containing protein n=1 Tax=Candida glabrata (strain ATCC 2001 / BCRC 20586 / JCM 3761 / NBRC 0622 / NRRL Y-65 / CBS 138) TaxID=284593 RepID=Q6FQQ4_CANGA|nr:uncharacterized protein CAGL0I04400g [Nakaseomyces glabratus]KAH7585750.1 RNA polymerase Rpb4 [Nakaseomyces glabratus]KAH7599382.1 RNA polymerase Rpb4 [Nakaseomyces glabratus]KAH7599696.1 RNA polymerase Rpb4 [Nakaseomyces glabratus]KAH7604527.1 RNA polymerase Rpb4 [Nakaseomyces glabratus]KAH7612795.1 RNA polymerase Rpb4 [Nakaseomyces glabratus]|eukprot:XP_447440.1 uncharacterized protein CAGL0I04400g [[Candida] glabrata]